LLAAAHRSSLELARQHHLRSIAFPAISTGAYGYPLDEAGEVALETVKGYLGTHPEIALVRFVLWGEPALAAYLRAAQKVLAA
jgi:O-acetyl-ADP-ribose deacetylase (regulator of RNase III)